MWITKIFVGKNARLQNANDVKKNLCHSGKKSDSLVSSEILGRMALFVCSISNPP
jgi:hypothetical protein